MFDSKIAINQLDWDTDYFGIKIGKVVLDKPLNNDEWQELKNDFGNYDLVMVDNRDSDPVNARLIGLDTNAFIADVNIQFIKKITGCDEYLDSIDIKEDMDRNEDVLALSNFEYSKFIADPKLRERGGGQVYLEWLKNSFNKENKFFALYLENNTVHGYVLFSFTDTHCSIELIAVSSDVAGKGIGEKLFKAVETMTFRKGLTVIKVDTQFRNIRAINFYHKMGCKQTEVHQVYHLWNKQSTD